MTKMQRATWPIRDLEPTDTIPRLCVPEMFSRQLLSIGAMAPLHPAPWECWVTNPELLRLGPNTDGACMFSCTGEPCDCGCGCGWGNLGCGWGCLARGRVPEYSE
jgi:hypothetical protein